MDHEHSFMQNLRFVQGFPVTQENAEQAMYSLYTHISSVCMLHSTVLYVSDLVVRNH